MKFGSTFVDFSCPKVMGILNVTPDSFSDGGNFTHIDDALYRVETMLEEGADFIDVGGESTRPGAEDVVIEEEIQRVIPIIEGIKKRFDTLISVDTSKAMVMEEAAKAGAHLINDVRALREQGAVQAAVNANIPVCLMHMQGQPRSMQSAPSYTNLIGEVKSFLQERINACLVAGIKREHLMLDPGYGFGKSLQHNYELLAKVGELHEFNMPLLIGLSRKSMIGNLLNRKVDQRLAGSLAAATIALTKGAHILRVHDVKETVDAVKVFQAVKDNNK